LGIRLQKFDKVDAECHRQLVYRDHSRVTLTLFQTTDVLLAESGELRQLLLRQALLLPMRLTLLPTSSRMSMRPGSTKR
jgi:hypothetical protein